MGEGGFNWGYACSMLGIMKIVTLVLGIVEVVLLFQGQNNAIEYTKDGEIIDCTTGGGSGGSPHPCPKKFLNYTALVTSLTGLCISVLCFILLLLMKLNESGLWNLMDYIYHYFFGVAIIVGGLFSIVYSIVAYAQCDYNTSCTLKSNEAQYGCNYFLPAGIFGFFNGILYIIIGLKIKKS